MFTQSSGFAASTASLNHFNFELPRVNSSSPLDTRRLSSNFRPSDACREPIYEDEEEQYDREHAGSRLSSIRSTSIHKLGVKEKTGLGKSATFASLRKKVSFNEFGEKMNSLAEKMRFGGSKIDISELFPPPPPPPNPELAYDFRPPPFDRTVDLMASCDIPELPVQFTMQKPRASGRRSRSHALFTLPRTVRRKIYRFCFPDECRKISLSPHSATQHAFNELYFASPWDILEDVKGGLKAFRKLRQDLMIYFWTEYEFHVTLTPTAGPMFSPLSVVWLPNYLDIVQKLTVEVDLTRFGTAYHPSSPLFSLKKAKERRMFEEIIEGINKRRGKSTMEALSILCRRYHGYHDPKLFGLESFDDLEDDDRYNFSDESHYAVQVVHARSDPLPYCPEEVMSLFDCTVNLHKVLRCLRLAGLFYHYSHGLMEVTMMIDDKLVYVKPAGPAWPIPPSPGSIVASSRSSPHAASYETTCGVGPDIAELARILNENKSVAENIGEELHRYDSSIYTESVPDDKPSKGEENMKVSRHGGKEPADQGTYQSLTASPPSSIFSKRTSSPRRNSRALSPKPQAIRPFSPNTMNEMNERDPIYQRSVLAFRASRGLDLSSNRSSSAQVVERPNIETPGDMKRCTTSLCITQKGKAQKISEKVANTFRCST
ncbi:hypothetical protein G7Y89_g7764 [Cudoniella acicularis]|uniref:Uncharacterized protein n=1 Tax=Cudoniella acicularis TaxID=354080 RepID=A0A8H4RHW6_9HELO|nr:hypothetical protein G7Y89_g7764 [Cudoniella acicularis]